LVFYTVVQVGGSIRIDTELGKAALAFVGENFPITRTKDDGDVLFAADLYFWWEENRAQYEPFPLFDEWRKRDFAQKIVLPMYRSTRKRE